jgi:hypothetical protein
MADVVKKNTVVFIAEETVEGVYQAPVAGSDAIQVLEDGMELTPSKELVERSVSSGGIGKVAGRPGQRSVSASLPVEMKAGSTQGSAPEYGLLLHSLLGGKRTVASAVTASESDGASGDSETVPLADADKNKYAVNDVVRVRRSGSPDHIARVTAVSNTNASVSITVEPELEYGDSFGTGDVVSAVTTYYGDNSGHKTLSITKEIEGALIEKAVGCKVSSMSINNFSTGQIADFGFSLEGLNFARVLDSTGLTAAYDTSVPPLILGACVFKDGVKVEVNEVSVSVENALAFKTSTCSENGRINSRVTERSASGSFNPYKQDDDISFFSAFEANTKFDLMFYAYNPAGANHDTKNEVVAVLIPDCMVSEVGESDQDGLLQDNISFIADQAKVFISFI